MIFATVGTQLPFPRFMAALNRIAVSHNLKIVAQTCEPDGDYPNLEAYDQLGPVSFDAHAASAALIVGHAGIGTILSARRVSKPLILYPRRASLGEHRNEHQLATVGSLGEREGIYIAYDDAALEKLIIHGALKPLKGGDSPTRQQLVNRLREYIAA